MKRLTQELPIGKSNQGMDLYATVQVEDEEPNRFKCESFLGAFVRELYGMMSGGRFERPVIMGAFGGFGEDPGGTEASDDYTEFDSVLTNDDNEIYVVADENRSFSLGTDFDNANPTRIWVWGVGGITEANGVHFIDKTSDIRAYLVDDSGTRLTSEGAYVPGTGRFVTYQNAPYRNNDDHLFGLTQWRVIVGSGTAPVNASDIGLENRLKHGNGANQLEPGSTTEYSVQTTDKPTTRMTLTRSFTNNSGDNISIKEIGIITSTSSGVQNSDYTQFLIVRDVLDSASTIPNGKTITISYEIIFRLSPDTQNTDADGTNGGFLEDFLFLLRRNLIDADEDRAGYFGMGLGGGISNPTSDDSVQGWQYGLRLGTDNKFASMTDDAMLAGIAHGDADGQLWHGGTNFEPPVIDDVANEASFEVTKIYENRGATPITIAEMGLYGSDDFGGVGNFNSTPALLARTALAPADQVTVQPGEFLLAEYVIKAVV